MHIHLIPFCIRHITHLLLCQLDRGHERERMTILRGPAAGGDMHEPPHVGDIPRHPHLGHHQHRDAVVFARHGGFVPRAGSERNRRNGVHVERKRGSVRVQHLASIEYPFGPSMRGVRHRSTPSEGG